MSHTSESGSEGSDNVLREEEKVDYMLMEPVIRRRLHRNSENLNISLDEMRSVISDGSQYFTPSHG